MSAIKSGSNKLPQEPPSGAEGWRQVVAQGALDSYRDEDVVAAIQVLGPRGDKQLLQDLMKHISDRMMVLLRRFVGWNKHNQGWDIIEYAHAKLIEAVLKPNSADGKNLREAFYARVKYRALDAIVVEERDLSRYESYQLDDNRNPLEPADPVQDPIHETAYVEQILSLIPDKRKRLAFRLHMEGCPLAKGKGSTSIAGALGVSDKTAGEWIAEVQAFLKEKGVGQ